MQQIIFIILAAVYILAIIRQIFYWSWLWQIKEYRWDRLRAHFQDIGLKSTFLTCAGYSSLRQSITPKLTVKILLVIILSFSAGAIILFLIFRDFYPIVQSFDFSDFFSYRNFMFNNKFLFGYLLIGYLLMPAFVFFLLGILNGLSAIFNKITIARASAKMAKFPNLKVVGITGSYGKSTTKEILADILSEKFKVIRTPANINTAIGIAQLILDKLDESYEIFVVEMGAYKTGEIKEICDMVKPCIGIITAINEQHLALFGSISNTIKAKFEIIDCLPNTGLAILNVGDANIEAGMELRSAAADRVKARVVKYSVGAKADVYAMGESSDRQSVKFKYISGSKIKDFVVNITGIHNISNALAAIIAAEDFGMDMDTISQILRKVNYMDTALKNMAGPNGSILINDTYNANPDGVFAALRHIKNQRGRKIIIMTSLIELGSSAQEIHQKLGEEISAIAAKIYFLDNYYISDIRKGIAKNKESDIEIKSEKSAKKISEDLKNELRPTDTVLFINRGARKVLEFLYKNNSDI